jgi:hypothetical protein
MLPGPSVVVSCPLCNVVGCYETQISGNTLRGTYYTDGKAVFPMMVQVPDVVQCPGCRRPYWLSLATELGEVDRWGSADTDQDGLPINPHFRDAPVLSEPMNQRCDCLPGGEVTIAIGWTSPSPSQSQPLPICRN